MRFVVAGGGFAGLSAARPSTTTSCAGRFGVHARIEEIIRRESPASPTPPGPPRDELIDLLA